MTLKDNVGACQLDQISELGFLTAYINSLAKQDWYGYCYDIEGQCRGMYVSFLVFEVPWFMTLGDNVSLLSCDKQLSAYDSYGYV